MPLYVRDERVNQLAEQARRILNAPTKTDVIRQALEKVVADAEPGTEPDERPLAERLKAFRDRYQSMGTPDPNFDEKKFLDEMWEI